MDSIYWLVNHNFGWLNPSFPLENTMFIHFCWLMRNFLLVKSQKMLVESSSAEVPGKSSRRWAAGRRDPEPGAATTVLWVSLVDVKSHSLTGISGIIGTDIMDIIVYNSIYIYSIYIYIWSPPPYDPPMCHLYCYLQHKRWRVEGGRWGGAEHIYIVYR